MNADLNSNIGDVTERAEVSPPPVVSTPTGAPADAWAANHLILGGWEDSVPNEHRCHQIDTVLEALPAASMAQQLRLLAPRCGALSSAVVDAHSSGERPLRRQSEDAVQGAPPPVTLGRH